MTVNKTEEMVYRICRQSFLSLWSHPNPLRGDGKELCDVLVVFDPHVLIFSVKEIAYRDDVEEPVAYRRWEKRAIDESVKQIYRAEKWINLERKIVTRDGNEILGFSNTENRRICRIGIALGAKGRAAIGSGDYGKGFVHVYDEDSLHFVMRELDTIADFAKYLADVESFLKHDKQVLIMEGGHQDLLALYLTNNRSFPFVADKLIIEGGLWQKIENRPEFIRRKQEDKVSYLWDRIIEEFSLCLQSGILEVQSEPSETENVLRVMASEDRFSRRLLAKELLEMQLTTPKTHRRAKIVPALSGVTYVFLICEKDLDRDSRRHELGARCFVARGKFPSSPVVVGIATEHMNPEGHSFDAFYLRIDKWREENQRAFERTQEEFGFFDHARMIHVTDHEYPTDDRSTVGDARQSK